MIWSFSDGNATLAVSKSPSSSFWEVRSHARSRSRGSEASRDRQTAWASSRLPPAERWVALERKKKRSLRGRGGQYIHTYPAQFQKLRLKFTRFNRAEEIYQILQIFDFKDVHNQITSYSFDSFEQISSNFVTFRSPRPHNTARVGARGPARILSESVKQTANSANCIICKISSEIFRRWQNVRLGEERSTNCVCIVRCYSQGQTMVISLEVIR